MNIGKYFPEKRHLSSTSDDGEAAKIHEKEVWTMNQLPQCLQIFPQITKKYGTWFKGVLHKFQVFFQIKRLIKISIWAKFHFQMTVGFSATYVKLKFWSCRINESFFTITFAIVYKKTYKWYFERQWGTASGTTSENKWQRMTTYTQRVTQQVTVSDNKWCNQW